jgi:hypothetical protein
MDGCRSLRQTALDATSCRQTSPPIIVCCLPILCPEEAFAARKRLSYILIAIARSLKSRKPESSTATKPFSQFAQGLQTSV